MNPILADRTVRWSGSATRRAAPGPDKQYAAAIDRHRTRATRHKNGDPNSPSFRNLQFIDQLARSPHTSPWPQIAEEIGVAKRVEFDGKSTEELRDRVIELMAGEHERQARQDSALQLAALSGDFSQVREACMTHADALIEIGYLSDEISDREARGR